MLTEKLSIRIFHAKRKHFPSVLKLIQELATFEKLTPPDKKAGKRLLKDAFGKKRCFNLLIASLGGKIIGYAFYFFTYSSFLAKKTLYLEDIFISDSYRNLNIGKKFFWELRKIARKNNCGRIEFCVLNWNKKALAFYEKLGAVKMKEWTYYRISL
jgi:GNAT superfamily N-acetyltransferase